jgi:exodeoxyribonuclease V alpha subunit
MALANSILERCDDSSGAVIGVFLAAYRDLGKVTPEDHSDYYFVPGDSPETAVPRILELVKTRIPKRFGLDPIRDIQVLCPMNRGGAGARALNIELQVVLNPVAGDRKVERLVGPLRPATR